MESSKTRSVTLFDGAFTGDNLVLSAGATSGFIYLLSQIFPNKTIIWAEQLSYFLAISMLKNSLSFPIRDVKIESDGIDLEDLETKWYSTYSIIECKEAKKNQKFLGALYLVPGNATKYA
uniref:Uncharacterized protein n=1 Tax=Panagrolaimus davidi TaxID=227884 RepID=A0A914PA00_9BILA